jgi:hypothetical protein
LSGKILQKSLLGLAFQIIVNYILRKATSKTGEKKDG